MSRDSIFNSSTPTRRSFLAMTAAGLAGLGERRGAAAEPWLGGLPITGASDPDLAPFDELMTSFVEENEVPGASLAVTKDGRLVYARGFGYASVEAKEAVKPEHTFRIASVSKPITAVAILQLVEKGKLKLEDRVVERMKVVPPAGAKSPKDERWNRITVRQCLQHTGGWDRDRSFDPIGRPWEIAEALGIQPPVRPDAIVQYMLGQPLDFDPGARFAYSNLGYLVLGRILEAVSGRNYEDYVKKEVLAPLRIRSAKLGKVRREDRAKDEVEYYDRRSRTGRMLTPPDPEKEVPIQYGAENFEGFEAHGGWIASAIDLVRFASAFDHPDRSPTLKRASIETMWARPEGAAGFDGSGKPKAAFYGGGWMVRPVGTDGAANHWHTGFIAGSESLLVRRWDGLNWGVLFNTATNPKGDSLAGAIDPLVHRAADRVKRWPKGDRFAQFLK